MWGLSCLSSEVSAISECYIYLVVMQVCGEFSCFVSEAAWVPDQYFGESLFLFQGLDDTYYRLNLVNRVRAWEVMFLDQIQDA